MLDKIKKIGLFIVLYLLFLFSMLVILFRNNGIYKAITDSVKYGMKYEALRNATAML